MAKRVVRERLYVIVGVVVLVVVLVFAIGVVLWQKDREKASTDRPKTTLTKEEAEQERLSRQVEDTKAEELKKAILAETDKQTKATQLNDLMLIYFNRGEYDQALSLAKESEATYPTALSAGALGDVYFAQKDYDQAVKYYELAMERSEKPTNERERSPYNEYKYLKQQAEEAR
jgi:tetratricopeptide (TPR) repeat protein